MLRLSSSYQDWKSWSPCLLVLISSALAKLSVGWRVYVGAFPFSPLPSCNQQLHFLSPFALQQNQHLRKGLQNIFPLRNWWSFQDRSFVPLWGTEKWLLTFVEWRYHGLAEWAKVLLICHIQGSNPRSATYIRRSWESHFSSAALSILIRKLTSRLQCCGEGWAISVMSSKRAELVSVCLRFLLMSSLE